MKQHQTYGSQKDVDCLNIFKSVFDSRKDVDTVATTHNMMLSWNTCASFILTPLKADSVNYLEYVILVKDVTKT